MDGEGERLMSDIVISLIIFAGCSLTGWIFVGVALHTRRYQQKKEQNERSLATGQIVDLVKKTRHSGRGGTAVYYVPVVAFEANGRLFRLENENGNRDQEKITVGQAVDVLYDEQDPARFHLAEDDANEVASESLMRFGALLIAGAAALAVLNYFFHIF